jgi:hypothetical protein
MSTTDFPQREQRPRHRARSQSVLTALLIVLAALVLGGAGFIAYALWPRWPAPPVAADAPALPITIGGTVFNVPPAALRVPVQRRPGAHERIDLAFLWPSLAPPDPAGLAGTVPAASGAAATAAVAGPPGAAHATARTLDRLFVTIAVAGDTLAPAERVSVIYRRYVAEEPVAGPNGLAVLAFRAGTPYQGEDLIYDGAKPEVFLVRCSGNGAGPTPGICLYSRRIEAADVVVRFPRDWLDDWRAIDGGIERLIRSLRPRGG